MARGPWAEISVGLAVLGIVIAVASARGHETQEQLLQRIHNEQNPVKKAKDEIKLASLELNQLRDEYSAGHIESGAKLLGAFIGEMKTSWKLLQDSGRKASRQPEGFRELEISLREDVRSLQDLAQVVSYFDRAPLTNAADELERMRTDVLHAQFPGGSSRTHNESSLPQPVPSPSVPAEQR